MSPSLSYQPIISPAPATLIDQHGKLQQGLFDASVANLNVAAFRLHSVMDKPVSRLAQHFAYKQFQFVCISGPDWLLAVAIADVRYVCSGFAYLYQNNQPTREFALLAPLGFGCQLSASPQQGLASMGKGQKHWQINCAVENWTLRCQASGLDADLTLHFDQQQPLALAAPTGYNGWTYTEKNNALRVSGSLRLDGQTLDVQSARGGIDFSAGFMRRETSWRWSSINTMLQGQAFGLNLAAGVNETGLTENALWYDGEIQHLSPARFEFDRGQNTPWRVTTLCGEVDLTFTADFCRQEKLQLGILASNFRQYVGHYSGTVRLRDGRELQLQHCLGLAEDHYAKW
jgi:hypothetical protein